MGCTDNRLSLYVGDRVKGISSGHLGTVVKVYDDGRVDARKDPGHPSTEWARRMGVHSFILVARAEEIEPQFKKGDTVTAGGPQHEVLAVDGVHLWLKAEDGSHFTDTVSGWEKVTPFFEVGKSYQSGGNGSWQIYFQKHGTVVFEPVLIETEKESVYTTVRRVAIGKLTLAGTSSHRWTVMKQYEFDNGGWKKV